MGVISSRVVSRLLWLAAALIVAEKLRRMYNCEQALQAAHKKLPQERSASKPVESARTAEPASRPGPLPELSCQWISNTYGVNHVKKNWGVLAVTGKLILAPEGRPRAGENIGGWWLEHKCHTVPGGQLPEQAPVAQEAAPQPAASPQAAAAVDLSDRSLVFSAPCMEKVRAPPQQSCTAFYSAAHKAAILFIPKAASSSTRSMVDKYLPDAELVGCEAVPKEGVFLSAFLRDPVERLLSGYEEAVYRSINDGMSDAMPARIRSAIESVPPAEGAAKLDWLVFWDAMGPEKSMQLLEEYLEHDHSAWAPWETHLSLQTRFVGEVGKLDFVGRLDNFRADWTAMLGHLSARSGKPHEFDGEHEFQTNCVTADGKRGVRCKKKGAPQHRKNFWKHLHANKLSTKARHLACKHLLPDMQCLHYRSRWCNDTAAANS